MSASRSQKKSTANARFDTRLLESQKTLFEKAAKIKGYKSLSEFVVQVVQEASEEIIEKHNSILSSENDKKVFFDALTNPPQPNKALIKAAKLYQKRVS